MPRTKRGPFESVAKNVFYRGRNEASFSTWPKMFFTTDRKRPRLARGWNNASDDLPAGIQGCICKSGHPEGESIRGWQERIGTTNKRWPLENYQRGQKKKLATGQLATILNRQGMVEAGILWRCWPAFLGIPFLWLLFLVSLFSINFLRNIWPTWPAGIGRFGMAWLLGIVASWKNERMLIPGCQPWPFGASSCRGLKDSAKVPRQIAIATRAQANNAIADCY
jgi:hypothetical protein